jgi:hypothetical protein
MKNTYYNDYDGTIALFVSAMTEPTHSRSSILRDAAGQHSRIMIRLSGGCTAHQVQYHLEKRAEDPHQSVLVFRCSN